MGTLYFPREGHYSDTPHFPQEGRYSDTLHSPQEGRYSGILHFPQEEHYSDTLHFPQGRHSQREKCYWDRRHLGEKLRLRKRRCSRAGCRLPGRYWALQSVPPLSALRCWEKTLLRKVCFSPSLPRRLPRFPGHNSA